MSLPGVAKTLKKGDLRHVVQFVAAMAKRQESGEAHFSAECPATAPCLHVDCWTRVVGDLQHRTAGWRHVVNTGCMFGQYLTEKERPVMKERHWVHRRPEDGSLCEPIDVHGAAADGRGLCSNLAGAATEAHREAGSAGRRRSATEETTGPTDGR